MPVSNRVTELGVLLTNSFAGLFISVYSPPSTPHKKVTVPEHNADKIYLVTMNSKYSFTMMEI